MIPIKRQSGEEVGGKTVSLGFPCGSVVKNPPANTGDTGLIPDSGRSHVQQSNQAHAPQLLSLCSRARGSQLPCCNYGSPCALEPLRGSGSHHDEEAAHRSKEQPLLAASRAKASRQGRSSTAINT